MPWGSKLLGNYAKGAMNAGNYGRAAMASGLRDVISGMPGYSSATRRSVYGAMAGGAYGAASDDTSVLGGMAMGGAGARYLGAGFMRGSRIGSGMSLGQHAKEYGKGFGKAVYGQARADMRSMYRGARMQANRAFNAMPALGTRFGAGI